MAGARLLETLVRALVDNPDAVRVTEKRRDSQVILTLEVAPDDIGRVIGRQGRIIKAIRKVIRTTTGSEGRYTVVEVVSR